LLLIIQHTRLDEDLAPGDTHFVLKAKPKCISSARFTQLRTTASSWAFTTCQNISVLTLFLASAESCRRFGILPKKVRYAEKINQIPGYEKGRVQRINATDE
jgi:hypothetical protein